MINTAENKTLFSSRGSFRDLRHIFLVEGPECTLTVLSYNCVYLKWSCTQGPSQCNSFPVFSSALLVPSCSTRYFGNLYPNYTPLELDLTNTVTDETILNDERDWSLRVPLFNIGVCYVPKNEHRTDLLQSILTYKLEVKDRGILSIYTVISELTCLSKDSSLFLNELGLSYSWKILSP